MEQASRLLADVVAVIHLGFLGYVVAGGFLAWRWPRSLMPHTLVVGWAALIVTLGPPCPLTGLQDWLRARAGLPPLPGGFIDNYVEGVLYPAELTPLIQAVAVLAVAVSWYGCWSRRFPARSKHRT